MACRRHSTGIYHCDSSHDWRALLEAASAQDHLDPAVVAITRQLRTWHGALAWILDHITYQDDPEGIELFRAPTETIGAGVGDCDDIARLLRAMLRALHLPARYVYWTDERGELAHVAVQVPGIGIIDPTAELQRHD